MTAKATVMIAKLTLHKKADEKRPSTKKYGISDELARKATSVNAERYADVISGSPNINTNMLDRSNLVE